MPREPVCDSASYLWYVEAWGRDVHFGGSPEGVGNVKLPLGVSFTPPICMHTKGIGLVETTVPPLALYIVF